MDSARFVQKYVLTLTAGQELPINRAGTFVHVISAGGDLKIGTDQEALADFEAGLGIELEKPFRRFRVYSDTAQTIEIMAGHGRIVDARTVLTSGAVVGVGGSGSINGAAVTVGVAATLIAAANSSRRSILIQALGADMYIGGAGVTVAGGVKLPKDETLTLETTAAVYAISGTAGNDARYLEEVN